MHPRKGDGAEFTVVRRENMQPEEMHYGSDGFFVWDFLNWGLKKYKSWSSLVMTMLNQKVLIMAVIQVGKSVSHGNFEKY